MITDFPAIVNSNKPKMEIVKKLSKLDIVKNLFLRYIIFNENVFFLLYI